MVFSKRILNKRKKMNIIKHVQNRIVMNGPCSKF